MNSNTGDKVYELFARPPVYSDTTGRVSCGERLSFGLFPTQARAEIWGAHLVAHEIALTYSVDERTVR